MPTYGELFSIGPNGLYGDYGLGACASALTYNTAYVDQAAPDTYSVTTSPQCVVQVNAPNTNAATAGNVFLFWPVGSGPLDAALVSSTWEGNSGTASQGHFHRLVQTGARQTGIIVLNSDTEPWKFSAYLFDSTETVPLSQIGATIALSPLQSQALPWTVSTRLVGSNLSVKAWPIAQPEPPWTSSTNVASWTVPTHGPGPFQTSSMGLSGWAAASLPPGTVATYTGLSISPEQQTAVFTGQRGRYSAEDLLNLADGVGQVSLTFRFEVLDSRLSYLFDVSPPTSARMTLRVSTSQTVKRVLDGFELTPLDALKIDPFSHRLRPIYKLETGDEWPLGVFLFDDSALHHNSAGSSFSAPLTDQTPIIDQPRLGSYSIPVGGAIYPQIVRLLNQFGVQYSIPATSHAVASTPVSWKPGDSTYTVLANLFALCHWYPPYFDNFGVLRGRPIPSPEGSHGAHVYTTGSSDAVGGVSGFVDATPSRIFDKSLTELDGLVQAPNRYVVTSPQTQGAPITATYVPPESFPNSRARRGFWITSYASVNGLTNKAQAYQHARNNFITDVRANMNYEFASMPDPRHDIFDRVLLNGQICIETGHSMTLTPEGPHTHQVRKVWADVVA